MNAIFDQLLKGERYAGITLDATGKPTHHGELT